MQKHVHVGVGLSLLLMLSACAPEMAPSALTTGAITPASSVAPRGTSVSPGQTASVFTFAGLGEGCSSTAQPRITIDKAPTKSTVSFNPVEPTVMQYSLSGRCIGQRVAATGIYYAPRSGETGTDTFTISAYAGRGTVATRTINVTLVD